MNALGRLANVLDMKDKTTLFECFILSHFNFCPAVWNFCTIADMKKMENIQKRALRYTNLEKSHKRANNFANIYTMTTLRLIQNYVKEGINRYYMYIG